MYQLLPKCTLRRLEIVVPMCFFKRENSQFNFWTQNRALAQCVIRRNLFRSIASQIYVL